MLNINLSKYRIEIKFDKHPLAIEKNTYSTKIVNSYIVYDLDAWPINPTDNFRFKNCLFGAATKVKNSDKEKYACNGYGITFDSAGSWSFVNEFARNVIIIVVDSNSSFHSHNCKNNFLILGEVPTYGINGSFGLPEKSLVLILVKQAQNFT